MNTRVANLSLVLFALAHTCVLAAEPPPDMPVIRFLDKETAAKAIVQEKIEPYFSLLTPLDMAAKTGSPLEGTLAEQQEACRKRYAELTLDFTDQEKALLGACIQRVYPILKEHYPLAARVPWSLIKKSDRLEAGAHFTREDHIVLSERFLKAMVRDSKDVKIDDLVGGVMRLLLHEQTHVLQRLHPKLFAKLYAELWEMEHVRTIEPSDWLDARQLVNPDAVDLNWIARVKDEKTGATRLLWPRILLRKTKWPVAMFRDAEMVVLELEETGDGDVTAYCVKTADDGAPLRTPLREATAYTSRFKHGGAYHPNEASAGLWPAIVLGDLRGEQANLPEPVKAYEAKARKWLRAAMSR